MYFTDLSNTELQMFRKQNIKDNISLTLDKMKQSKLFHIKTITDSIVKIYPLFYCRTITSSNSEDYILGENKCIIAQNKNDTIFNFEVDDTAPIVLNRLNGYHDVKETLTMPEFNRLIYLNRHGNELVDNINLEKSTTEILEQQIDINLIGDYTNNLNKITLSGVLKNKNEEILPNKPLQVYIYTNNGWKYENTITTNQNGEYSYTDYSVVYFSDNSNVGSFTDLQNIIDNAINNNQSEITLNQQYRFEYGDSPITITAPIKINGNGHVIDGANHSQIFNITGNNVILNDLILIQGNIDGNGAGINWSGDDGILSNTSVFDCISDDAGGAVYWSGLNGEISNCRFVNNATNGVGTIYSSSANMKMYDNVVYGCFAGQDGGCLYSSGDYLTVDGLIAHYNTTNGNSPAAIRVVGSYSTLRFDLKYSEFNKAYRNKTNKSVDNSFEYKVVPSPSWVDNPDDFAAIGKYDVITKSSKIEKNIIHCNGDYGEYEFDVSSDSIVDDGILITTKTLQYPSTINLKGRTFKDSTYTATFKYYSITDYNILDDVNSDNIVYDTISVDLEPYNPVVIPFEQLDEKIIVGFDVAISIKHDKPVIRYEQTLSLSSNKNRQKLGEPVVLTATYRDEHGGAVANIPITFKESNSILGTVNTDSNGEATYTYNPATDGIKHLTANYDVYESNEIEIEFYYDVPAHISLSNNKNILSYKNNESCTLTATVTNANNEPCTNTKVSLNTYLMNESVNIGQTVYPDRKIGDSYQVLVNTGTVVIGDANNQIQISNAGVNVISGGSAVKSWVAQYPEVFIRNNVLSVDDEDYDLTGKNINTGILYSLAPVGNTVNCSIIGRQELTTNSNGVASYTYNSMGAGDIMFECGAGMVASNAVNVEDCHYSYPYFVNDSMSVDVPLPSYDYKITYKTESQNLGGSKAYFVLNNGQNDTIVGLNSTDGQNGIYPSPLTNTDIPSDMVDVSFNYLKDDAEYVYSWGEVFLIKDNITTPANKLTGLYQNFADIGNIKIKGLYIPQVEEIQVSATKDILSYADGESTMFTANVGLQNKVVNVYKNNVFYDSFVTDAGGECSFLYESEGVGDVEFRFECMSVIETYSIIDAVYYNSNTLSSSSTLNIPSIPSNFKATFKAKATRTSYISIGENSNNLFLFGITGSNGRGSGIYVKENGSYTDINQDSVLSSNVEYDFEYTYENGVQTLKVNNHTFTVNNSHITGRNYVYYDSDGGTLSNLLIKPL